jgi:nicotinate-nucleotide adenylyltransferase
MGGAVTGLDRTARPQPRGRGDPDPRASSGSAGDAEPTWPMPPVPVVPGRTGVLGGTFDPIHVVHLEMAEAVREAVGMEQVLFVPAGSPWQKASRPVTSPDERLEMVRLAIAGNPAFQASAVEIERSGPTYTVATMTELADAIRAGGAEPDLWFILSSEALRGLPTWRDPEGLLARCRLAVVPRAPWDGRGRSEPPVDAAWVADRYPAFADRVVFCDAVRSTLSSTEIRRRVAAGRSIRYLVPDAVAAYIDDHGLYRGPDGRNEPT